MKKFLNGKMLLALTCLLLSLTGCQKAPATPSADDFTLAETTRPAEPQLAAKYERSCHTCHAVAGSAAPLAGFVPQWEKPKQQAMATLVTHVRDGYNAMPARGFCNDCSDDDYAKLIAFMSAPLRKNGS